MKILLRSGRTIFLSALNQYGTYAGLLCGKPDREMNYRKIQDVLQGAQEKFSGLGRPFLVEPKRYPLKDRDCSSNFVYEKLPAVTCIAVFESDELNKPDSEPYSSLVVVWYQDLFALPIAADVQLLIEEIDWENSATDWMP